MKSPERTRVCSLNRPRRRHAIGTLLPAALLIAGQLLSASPAMATQVLPMLPTGAAGPIGVVAREVQTSVGHERIVELPIPASHIAIHWHGSPSATISIALAKALDAFGPQIPVELDEEGQASDANGETFGSVIWADGARLLRITSDQPIDRLTVVAMDSNGAGATVLGGGTAIDAAMAQSAVITRAGWGANESLRFDAGGHEHWPPSFNPVQKFFVHHTAGRNGDPNPAATIRAIYYDHAVVRGWGDIGYNFLIDESGRIYEGRHARAYASGEVPTEEDRAGNVVRGGHAKGFNDGSVGIALLGTFTTQSPTAAARATLERLLAWESERHGIDPRGYGLYTNAVTGLRKSLWNISGHRDVSLTGCPGDAFYATLPNLRVAVANRIAAASGPSVDHAAPVVTSFVPMATNPTGSHSIGFGLIFNEPVTGLAASDFAVSGSSAGWSVSGLSGAGAVYTVTVSADQPVNGSVVLTLASGSLADLAGSAGPVSPAGATATYALDGVAPSVLLLATPNVTVSSGSAFDVTITFSEPVAGLTSGDVVLGGVSNTATPWTVSAVSGSGAHYAATITRGSPAIGDLTIRVPAAAATDVAANPNLASNTLGVAIVASSEVYDPPRTLIFAAGTYTGYKFSSTGAVLGTKAYTLSKSSSAPTTRRASIAGRTGSWYYISAGIWAGYWVKDASGLTFKSTTASVSTLYDPPRTLIFAAGTYTGYKFSSTGVVLGAKAYTLGQSSSAPTTRHASIAGQSGTWYYISAGIWAGYWIRAASGLTLN